MLLPCLVLLTSCAGQVRSNHDPLPHATSAAWAAGQVIDVRTGLTVSRSEWEQTLSSYDVIYLGEEHRNSHHISAALAVLQAVLSHGRHPILAMEMFGWDGQPALDEYVRSSEASRERFLDRVLWKQNWGGPFEDYEPLVQFAKDRHLSVVAMNPPKSLIRQVVQYGVAGMRKRPDWSQWEMASESIVDDPAYRDRILTQLQACHGGGAPEDYQTMYEASMVRDEGMAKTVAALVRSSRSNGQQAAGPVISYTGGGHIQYKLPVPNRVARRIPVGLKQVTVYLSTFEQSREAELKESMRDGIADYIWLTPVGSQGPPKRCR